MGEEQEVALVCSTRVLTPEQLAAVADRCRRGEPVQPSHALRSRARALLRGAPIRAEAKLRPSQLVVLVFANLLLTPLLGYALWLKVRRQPGPGARQVLLATLPVSVVLALVFVGRIFFR